MIEEKTKKLTELEQRANEFANSYCNTCSICCETKICSLKEQRISEYIQIAKEQQKVDVESVINLLEYTLPNCEYITNMSAFRQDKKQYIESFKKKILGDLYEQEGF